MAVVINDFEVIPGDQGPKPAEGGHKSNSPKPFVLSPSPAAMSVQKLAQKRILSLRPGEPGTLCEGAEVPVTNRLRGE